MFPTHKELKQQVVVWILVLKADRALFLQMDSVDERDRAFIPVGLQIVSLRHPGRTARQKMSKFILHSLSGFHFFLHPPHRPVAGEPVISVGTVFQRGCQATESSGHGIPLVEADAAAEGVASRCTLGTLLSRHLQELPSLTREGWRTRGEEAQRDGKTNIKYNASQPSSHSVAKVTQCNTD